MTGKHFGTVQPRLDLRGLKIVVDASNGACYKVDPAVLAELGATVIATGVEPNGTNINDGVGSTCIDHLQRENRGQKPGSQKPGSKTGKNRGQKPGSKTGVKKPGSSLDS